MFMCASLAAAAYTVVIAVDRVYWQWDFNGEYADYANYSSE
jgi:hypothetical protein